MSEVHWAGASMCPSCKRVARHKPRGGPHRWHGCRLRWIARKIAHAERRGWDEGYRFAVEHIEEPMVYADVAEYGSGWSGLIAKGGITIEADS